MVRGGDHDGVAGFGGFVEEDAIVFEDLGLGELIEGCGGFLFVDVAEGDDVFGGHVIEDACALATDADAGDVEFFGGGGLALAEDVARDDLPSGGSGGGGLEECAAAGFGH